MTQKQESLVTMYLWWGSDAFCLAQLTTKWPGCFLSLSLFVSEFSGIFVLAEFGLSDSDSLISYTVSNTIPLYHNEITQTHTCTLKNKETLVHAIETYRDAVRLMFETREERGAERMRMTNERAKGLRQSQRWRAGGG